MGERRSFARKTFETSTFVIQNALGTRAGRFGHGAFPSQTRLAPARQLKVFSFLAAVPLLPSW